jgi:hypothetical protein
LYFVVVVVVVFVLDLFAMDCFPFVSPLPKKKKTKGNFLPKSPNNELIVHTNLMVNIPQNARPNENYIVFVVLSSKPTKF